ncbi:MAG: hypothetical protein AB1705_15590 [Verrucomicrobiota bacterium]
MFTTQKSLLAGIGVIAAATVGVLLWTRFVPDQDVTDPEPWQKLRAGMSKKEVVALLGDPRREFGATYIFKEVWQYYGTTEIIQLRPAKDGYLVYFSSDGKATSFRRPPKSARVKTWERYDSSPPPPVPVLPAGK